MKKFAIGISSLLLCLPLLAYADNLAPVVAGNNNAVMGLDGNTTGTSNLTLEQRVARLERQVNAMNQINLMSQVTNLQQQVQQLQGQVQVLTHNLQNLQNQSVTQYAALDQRLQNLGSKNNKSAVAPLNTDSNTAATVNASADSANPLTANSTNGMMNTGNNIPASDTSIASPSNNTNFANSDNNSDSSDAPNLPNASAGEQSAYQAAYAKIKNRQYSQATNALQGFLVQYPNGPYAPNAWYWLGQLSLLQGNGKGAERYFNTLIANYPNSPKVRDANLKLGFAYILENKMHEAKAQFKEVIRQYPGTTTAQMAQARLAQLP